MADAHHSVSVAEALIPVCVAEGTKVAEAVAFGYSLYTEDTDVVFIVGSLVGIAEFGYEVAVTQMTCVLVASTVTVVVVVMGSRLAHKSARNPDGDRRSARRWTAGRDEGCAEAARGEATRETSDKADKRL